MIFCSIGKFRPTRQILALSILALMTAQTLAMDLLTAYRLALENDARFQAARAANLAGQEPLSQARAQLLPNVALSGMRTKASTETTNDKGSNQNDYFSSSYSLQIRQPLYRKYNFAQYQQAKAQLQATDASLERGREDLVLRLSSTYFEALMAHEDLALVMAQKETYAAQIEGARRALAAGTGTRTDIDDAKARYDMTLAQELEARQNVDLTRRGVQMLVNRPVNQLASLDPSRLVLSPLAPAHPENWVDLGEKNNPELRALRAGLEAAHQEVEKARAGHHPTADLIAQRNKGQSETVTSINTHYFTSQVGVQFNFPIFSGGYVNSTIRQAEANLDRLQQEYEARRREVELDVRKEFQNVINGILKIRAREQALRSADQAAFSTRKGFQAGVRTSIDILNAEQQRINALRDLAEARYQYILAQVRLQSLATATGEEALSAANAWLSETRTSTNIQ